MYNTLDDAKAALTALASTGDALKTDLINLIRQVSVQAQGVTANATTVLYSGMIGEIHSSNIVDGMAADSSIRTVDKTIAADLLKSREFQTKVAAAFGKTFDEFIDLPNSDPANQWLFRNADGPWVNVSERFVDATEGKVKLLTLAPDPEGVLYKYELPKLLQKLESGTSITEIDGLSRTDLLKVGASYSTNWTDVMRKALLNNAVTQTHLAKPLAGSYGTYLDLTPEGMNNLYKNASADDLNKLYGYTSNFELPKAATKALNKFGLIGGLLSAGLMSTQAAAAELAGDSEGARHIVEEWAVDMAGSVAGEAIGASIGAVALTLAAVAGVTISAPLAGAVILGASLIGGIFGGDGARGIYELTKDKDANGRRDFIDKLSNLLFGEYATLTTPLPADLNGEQLTLDTTFSREEMVAQAKINIAWRYALRELNSFVIPDISYDRHNLDGSLDLYDPATGEGLMTDLYLQDRAAMLTWKIRYDKGEHDDDDPVLRTIPKSYTENWDTESVVGNWDFVDLAHRVPGGAPLTLSIDGKGLSLHDHQIVFGSKHG